MSDTSSEPNYQDILNKYAAELSQNPPQPEAQIEPQPQVKSQPQPKSTPENLVSLPQPEPQAQLIESQPEPKIEPQPQPEPISPPPPAPPAPPVIPPSDDLYTPLTSEPAVDKGNGFFKVLFFLSLFLFIGVAAAVVYSFINSQKPLSNNQNTPSIGSSPTISASTCKINDQEYSVGESFAATDGCNTCTCYPDLTVSCTEKSCDATSSASLKSQVENWDTYTKSTVKLSWDKCEGESTASASLKEMTSAYPVFTKTINGVNLAYSSKLDFTNNDVANFKICEAGSYYPIYITANKILWLAPCSTGIAPTNQKCNDTLSEIKKIYNYK